MFRALWTAATGMFAQQMNVDIISNNLANVNTNGFKKSRADFQDLFYQTYEAAGTQTGTGTEKPTGLQVGLGVKPAGTQKLFGQGDYQETTNPLDMLVEGEGFFQVQLPDGSIAYTRDGAFKKDGEGRIVTSDGYPLEPAINVPQEASEISVSPDGVVTAKLPGGESSEIGTIELARFVNPAGLSNIGRNLFVVSPASGEPLTGTPAVEGFGTIAQGFLETSNVKVVEEMVNMIMAQRAYEVNSKVIMTSDDMISMANNIAR